MFVLHVLIFIGSFGVFDMQGKETNKDFPKKEYHNERIHSVSGSSNFLLIKDTLEEDKNP